MTIGPYGFPSAAATPVSTRPPSAAAISASARTRRVFPIPGSPETVSEIARPRTAGRHASLDLRWLALARPTNGSDAAAPAKARAVRARDRRLERIEGVAAADRVGERARLGHRLDTEVVGDTARERFMYRPRQRAGTVAELRSQRHDVPQRVLARRLQREQSARVFDRAGEIAVDAARDDERREVREVHRAQPLSLGQQPLFVVARIEEVAGVHLGGGGAAAFPGAERFEVADVDTGVALPAHVLRIAVDPRTRGKRRLQIAEVAAEVRTGRLVRCVGPERVRDIRT